ncbi:catalase [Tessaracoccus lacteus]|uniref:Catalase n=1 Tax=Tessaracoccus lacteus TaxID=3041766 RepID=A0ABY8PZL7_9ACTN|nr:catalase [Tessaracoccus sp. T21]WGT47965.1 catalase [Tessaracoccus sp. T21]
MTCPYRDGMHDPATPSTRLNGAPADSDQHSLTVGNDGPIVLHDVHLVEQLAHFNRERVAERSPHAKGSGAFGTFTVTQDVTAYTKAAPFQPGTKSQMLTRFSTVAGEQGSPDTWRDVRGFSVRFYSSEGNLDIVGNNTPVFFLRDPLKFPHFIRSQKRLPSSGLRDATMQWDFWTASPESAHQVTYLMGDRGLPATWRHMHGFSSHTYMWVNADGERFWVKYHWRSNQGEVNLTNEEAEKLAGADADAHRRDLYDAIERGEFPSWTLHMQVMPYAEANHYRFNPFDLTKTWSQKDYPLIEVGVMELNENPTNFFAQIEQAAFSPSNMIPGTGISPDKMLMARVFSYPDAQRARIGANFHQLPVNQPITAVNNYADQGHMQYQHTGGAPVYQPNSFGRMFSDAQGRAEEGWEADGPLVRAAATLHAEDDDWGQARTLLTEVFDDEQRDRFVDTVSGALSGITDAEVMARALQYWKNVDETVGGRIEAKLSGGGA